MGDLNREWGEDGWSGFSLEEIFSLWSVSAGWLEGDLKRLEFWMLTGRKLRLQGEVPEVICWVLILRGLNSPST